MSVFGKDWSVFAYFTDVFELVCADYLLYPWTRKDKITMGPITQLNKSNNVKAELLNV